eukprot:1410847-Pyramimonas_sp.AAC.1
MLGIVRRTDDIIGCTCTAQRIRAPSCNTTLFASSICYFGHDCVLVFAAAVLHLRCTVKGATVLWLYRLQNRRIARKSSNLYGTACFRCVLLACTTAPACATAPACTTAAAFTASPAHAATR